MNCHDFQDRMADALGNELSPQQQIAFDDHRAQCAACRDDFESYRKVVDMMKTLPGPKRVVLRREADRLVLQEADAPRQRPPTTPLSGALRYAASLLIAFTAGYALHAALTLTALNEPQPAASPIAVHTPPASTRTLESSLADTFTRNPGKSDLTKCLIAMARPHR